jgi:hypothetical protein
MRAEQSIFAFSYIRFQELDSMGWRSFRFVALRGQPVHPVNFHAQAQAGK